MQHHTHTALFTTVSGVVGGVGKAISVKPVMMAISFGAFTNVMVYAAASAAVGYVVKKALDKLADRINAKCNQNQNSQDDE